MKGRPSRRVPGLVLLGLVVATGVGAWIGVELATRWPYLAVERSLERFGIALRPIDPWSFRARADFPRYEAATVTVEGRVLVFGGFHNLRLQATPRVDEYDVARNRWRRLGDMPVVVTHANAVVLDGEVWIAGGFTGDHPGPATNQTWRYDLAADRWRPGPGLPEPRGGGVLAAAPDGALHYFGGWLPDRHTDSPDHWRLARGDSVWTPAAPLPQPRGHMGSAVVDGHIFAIGGTLQHDPNPIDVATVHRFDSRTGAWAERAPLPEALSHIEPSTFVHDGRIYVVGGRSIPTGQASAAGVWVYDPSSDSWSRVLGMPRGLLAPVATAVGDRMFLMLGGEDGARPTNRQSWSAGIGDPWRPAPAMPLALGEVAGGVIGTSLYLVGEGNSATLVLDLARGEWHPASHALRRPIEAHHHAAEVVAGELYLLGGLRRRSLDQVQIYNPTTGQWRLGPPLPFRAGASASAVIGGRIFLAGGIIDDTTTRQAASLDPATGAWQAIAPMPRARNHAASATDGRRLFVFGGRGPGSGDGNGVANGFGDVQVYDPATDRWTASGEPGAPPPLPQARGGMGKAVFLGGEFYVIGGETRDGPGASSAGVYSRVDIYNPLTNQWREGPPIPTPRHGIFPVARGPWIWVAGGGTRAGASASAVVEVLTVP